MRPRRTDLRQQLGGDNVSSGAPLERRHGLRRAVELVESGQAEVVVVAYFNGLGGSLEVQREVVDRIEQAAIAHLPLLVRATAGAADATVLRELVGGSRFLADRRDGDREDDLVYVAPLFAGNQLKACPRLAR